MDSHAIVTADIEGLIQHWNKGAEQLFGYSAAEASGQSLDLIVPHAYRERHWQAFRTAMSTGECRLDRAATNLPVTCKGGTVHVFPGRFVFLWDARNQVVGAIAIYATPAGSEQPFGPIVCA
jgi:PAS domain S-box-containing protein